MAYPETCFQNLIGVRGLCSPKEAMYWLDDIPGIDISKLASVAESNVTSGEKLAAKLIESGSRLMAADVEAIYDAQYKVQNTLVTGCSVCTFMNTYLAGPERGILIKDNTISSLSGLLIDKLTVKINSTGTFTIVIDDAVSLRLIEFEFEAGVEYQFTGLNYTTKKKEVRIYFQDPNVLLAQLSCPRNSSGCGCSGNSAVLSDLVYTGLTAGVESQQAYGFIPCATIKCDAADLLCFVANSAPRMMGMALLYKVAELYFQTRMQSLRNNKLVGTKDDDAKEDVTRYGKLYQNKLDGVGTRGVKDLVFTTLQQTNDVCVICNSLMATAWATG